MTVGYTIIGDSLNEDYEYIHEIMRNLAMDNQLLFNRDVKMIGSPGPNASNNFFDHVKNNPNMTWYGVVWCTTEWFIAEGAAIPCRYSHEVGRPFTSPRRH